MDKENTPFTLDSQSEEVFNKPIRAVPKPERNIGIDTEEHLYHNIINTGVSSKIDISELEGFTRTSQSRDQVYAMIDTMCNDSMIAAIIETYAEDATEYSDNGHIVWAESADDEVSKFVGVLLECLNIDKHIYKWAHALCKYGDVYVRLFRESDYDDLVFNSKKDKEDDKDVKDRTQLHESLDNKHTDKTNLIEDVILNYYSKNDKYVNYVEMVPNPAEVFELTKFGKTSGYIKTQITQQSALVDNMTNQVLQQKYKFNKRDVDVFEATEFVHAALEDNSSRTPEEVDIFIDSEEDESTKSVSYTVRRGQSLLYNIYKIWRELQLLENSILLNRVTKSSIVRIVGVEVGDMPKENVGPHLQGIKNLIEQKAALDSGTGMNEYTNPGPVENNIYVPTRDGKGAITTQQIGGDVDVKSLADLDYFKNKFFGALRVPKQYFGDTDDAAGFSGGQSLSIISSRYAKMIKRIQSTLIQMITDIINLILIDRNLSSYIGKFTIKMLPPTTQEEIDRRDNLSGKVQIVNDIINLTGDIEDPIAKLKILKALLSTVVTDSEVISIIAEEVERLEAEAKDAPVEDTPEESEEDFDSSEPLNLGGGSSMSGNDFDTGDEGESGDEEPTDSTDSSEESGTEETILPSPGELGDIDFTNNNSDF